MGILDYKTYQEAKEKFKWSEVWDLFDGTRDNFNIAHECIDRHVGKGTAVRIKFDDGHTEKYSFDEISVKSSQFANALIKLGIKKGDRVAVMLDPSLEFYVTLFGTLKRGAIAVPFYPQFGPEAIEYRLKDSQPKLMVTTEDKTKLFDNTLVDHLIIIGSQYNDFIAHEPEKYQKKNETTADDVAVLQYTSGTTRKFPEAVKHFHKSVPVLIPAAVFAVGLRKGDRYFCPSSPAWGGGLWYGTLAPLALGIAVGAYSGKFDEKILLEALEEFKINNLQAPPTAFRRIKNCGLVDNYKIKLDRISYSMEPMDTDTFEFLKKKFGAPPCSFYGSTEVGVIILNYNGYPDYEIKPGSLGKPMLGLEVAIIDEKGNKLPPGKIGEIALKRKDGWFRVKDAGVYDEEGYFWHKGRVDDVIISSGWTISSSEVEDALQKHSAVEEAVVVGAPDKDRGQIVKAYLKVNKEPSEALKKEIQDFVKERLSKHEYPRAIEFLNEIPKTTGGKIDRKKIKEWAAAG
jgi:acetyl-CoA synthetase